MFQLAICIALVTISGCSIKPIAKQKALFEGIDSYLQSQVDTAKLSPTPGITIAIVKGNELVHSKAFGVANLDTKKLLTPEYNFHIASISKTFTAAAIVQLAEYGKIDLNERLINYLPYFYMADSRYKEITIRQILNHTSGIPDVEDYEWSKNIGDDGAAERWTRSLASLKLLSKPGTEFHYSNSAYDVLADVIKWVTGQPFEAFTKYGLLSKLKMQNSSFLLSDIPDSLRTSPHVGVPLQVSKVYPYNRMHAPSSTLNSNAIELSKWVIANLNDGVYEGTQILSAKGIALMQSPTFEVDSLSGKSIGLAWFSYPYKGVNIINHDGADDGYVSVLCMVPSLKLGFVILFNSDEVNSYSIHNYVLNTLLTIYGNAGIRANKPEK
jgi:CubicO group peptidase (beta-lactamase class C family)